jgi:hypothetical protein
MLRAECVNQVTQSTTTCTHILLPLAVNSKSDQNVNSLQPLGHGPVMTMALITMVMLMIKGDDDDDDDDDN